MSIEVMVRFELIDAVRLGRWLCDEGGTEDDEWVTAMGWRILAAAQGAVVEGNDGG